MFWLARVLVTLYSGHLGKGHKCETKAGNAPVFPVLFRPAVNDRSYDASFPMNFTQTVAVFAALSSFCIVSISLVLLIGLVP